MLRTLRMVSAPFLMCACLCLTATTLPDKAVAQFHPLWDGETFEGWHRSGGGTWRIEGGVLIGTNTADNKWHGHLVTNDVYGDFTVRLKYRAVRGNSGLYFRIEETNDQIGVKGFQAEIDAEKDAGGLYETYGREWVVLPTPEQVKRYFKPGAWNEMTVAAKGGNIVVHVNGVESAHLTNDSGRRQGHIALQLHGSQDVEVHFKDIEIDGQPVQ